MQQLSIWTTSILSLALIATIGCQREPASETSTPAVASATPTSGRPVTWSDPWLTTSIQARYFADATVRGREIDVDTKDGIVTLSGSVRSDAERNQAVTLARQVEGVKRVEDQLRLTAERDMTKSPTDTRSPQAGPGNRTIAGAGWITTKIQGQYFMSADVKPWSVDVDTATTGVVTLRGEVDSAKAKQEAVRIAKSTEGVTDVVDRLTVRADTTGVTSPASATDATPSTAEQRAENAGEPLGDPWITATIQSKYYADHDVKGAQIDVTTDNGVVTLSGQIGSAAEKRQAIALARSTNGVRDVNDRLQIAGSANSATGRGVGERVEDGWITTKIQSKYFLDPQVRTLTIDTTTKNGIVTLQGVVDSAEVRSTAETIAKETDGVIRVVNNLTVKAGT